MKSILWAVCGVFIVLLLAAILFPIFVHESVPALSTKCMRNLSKLGMATEMYVGEHDGRFPPAKNWNDALREPLTRINASSEGVDRFFMCPSAFDDSQPTYAMNGRLEGLSERDVANPANTVRYFESIPGRNLHGGPELFPPEPRHNHGYAVLFVDGHVDIVPKSEVGKLNWEPKPTK